MDNTKFTFNFYRFTGTQGNRKTELVRDFSNADLMRGLVESNPNQIKLAIQKATDWASKVNLTLNPREPFPSTKYPGKVWLEFRFIGLSL